MSLQLRVFVLVFSVVFLASIVRLVMRKRLLLKYALLWMLIGVLLIFCAVFPHVVSRASHAVGIAMPSNFVFFVGLACLGGIALSLSVIVSRQANQIRRLLQSTALLEKRLRDAGLSDGWPDEGPDQGKRPGAGA